MNALVVANTQTMHASLAAKVIPSDALTVAASETRRERPRWVSATADTLGFLVSAPGVGVGVGVGVGCATVTAPRSFVVAANWL